MAGLFTTCAADQSCSLRKTPGNPTQECRRLLIDGRLAITTSQLAAENNLAVKNGLDVATNTATLRTRKKHLLASWCWSRIAVLSSSCSQIISHVWKGIHVCIEMKFTDFSLLRRLLCWEQLGARGMVNLSFRIRSQPAAVFHHQQPAPWVRAPLNPITLEIPSLSCKAPLLQQALHWSPQPRSARPYLHQ